jgi:integrase
MATAKKLPSGSWRCLAYSHTEKVIDEKTGKWKDKRIYESFTSDDPSPRGKKEAEAAAALFQLNKENHPRNTQYRNMTLFEAIDAYIESREAINRSPTTIQEYRCTQKYGFQDLMGLELKDLDTEILQEAINMEARRPSQGRNRKKTISAKRLKNEWGLVSAVLRKYRSDLNFSVELPPVAERVPELIPAETVLAVVKGTEIELAVLLAAWLSFSMSEVLGLTKSKSISGDYIRIAEVVVTVERKAVRKELAKNQCRNRTHRIPTYIKSLIDQVEGDVLVPMNGRVLYHHWIKLLDEHNLPHMTFHDLRHLNASVMALLKIPDKYAQERGGWKTDQIMKRVYTQTFPEERVKVDNIVDDFFENIVEPTPEEIDKNKYQAWLTLYDKQDCRQSKKEFLRFMQHEMQHEIKKAL